jgi:hypothetical protein
MVLSLAFCAWAGRVRQRERIANRNDRLRMEPISNMRVRIKGGYPPVWWTGKMRHNGYE